VYCSQVFSCLAPPDLLLRHCVHRPAQGGRAPGLATAPQQPVQAAAVVVAGVTAIGGGTVRDLLLDRHPIFRIQEGAHRSRAPFAGPGPRLTRDRARAVPATAPERERGFSSPHPVGCNVAAVGKTIQRGADRVPHSTPGSSVGAFS
jgi:hypothetical protein